LTFEFLCPACGGTATGEGFNMGELPGANAPFPKRLPQCLTSKPPCLNYRMRFKIYATINIETDRNQPAALARTLTPACTTAAPATTN
jgi:hypothetical protein